MRRFARFACIDWSGAQGDRQKGIALACTMGQQDAPILVAPPGGWSRTLILDWLIEQAGQGSNLLIGIDFSPSLPFADRGAFLPGWTDGPIDARHLWQLVDDLCAADPNLGASGFVDHPEASRHFRRHGGRLGDLFGAGGGRLRVTERQCRDDGHAAATSNFNLVGASQVGKSSLTGMRLLHNLAARVPIWPFDPVPDSGPLIVEVYTTIAARAAGIARGRSKIRDPETLDRALDALGSRPHAPLARYDDHSTDAIVTAAWLRHVAHDPRLWHPPRLTPAITVTEGWTFGIA